MKKTREELESLKYFCDRTYSGVYGNRLYVNEEAVFTPGSDFLGFCFKFIEPDTNRSVYQVVLARTGKEYTDFRIKMHEYGHIYLGHLDGIHEDLDRKIMTYFRDHRQELIVRLNASLGITNADVLLEKVIDDPTINHSLHNIAMDMEVNATVLSEEDVQEMEDDISSLYPKFSEELQKYIEEHPEEAEKMDVDIEELNKFAKKMDEELATKLILPNRYFISEGVPFPNDLTYPDYLLLLIEHLDQFLKRTISKAMGRELTKQDLQNILNNPNRDWERLSDEYKQGYQDALNDTLNNTPGKKENRPNDANGQKEYDQGYQDALDDLANGTSSGAGDFLSKILGNMGLGDGGSDTPGKIGPWQKKEKHTKERKGIRPDHDTPARRDADEKRKLGQIKAGGGIGCGDSGSAAGMRDVDHKVDAVDMALDEVVRNMRNRVIKVNLKRDLMRNYNRGIVRSVISPAVVNKTTIATSQKIVFLIDISGSMYTELIDRILVTIRINLNHLCSGLKYDIITWNTGLEDHFKDLDPRHPIPRISSSGGTRIAKGIRYFKENYGTEAVLVVISDFEDNLEEWNEEEKTMNGYLIYGFNYGTNSWGQKSTDIPWKNLKLRVFNGENDD